MDGMHLAILGAILVFTLGVIVFLLVDNYHS